MNLEFTVPPNLTFEQAIELTHEVLNANPSDDLLKTVVQALIATPNGSRGFFVVFLTDAFPQADSPGLLEALRSNPEAISDLLTKNLAMPTAMAITHRRNGHEDLAVSSDLTRSRTDRLIQQLNLPEIRTYLTDLHDTIVEKRSNSWSAFLDRWGYDDEQRTAIGNAMKTALAALPSCP